MRMKWRIQGNVADWLLWVYSSPFKSQLQYMSYLNKESWLLMKTNSWAKFRMFGMNHRGKEYTAYADLFSFQKNNNYRRLFFPHISVFYVFGDSTIDVHRFFNDQQTKFDCEEMKKL